MTEQTQGARIVEAITEEEANKLTTRRMVLTLILGAWIIGIVILFAAAHFEYSFSPAVYRVYMGQLVVSSIVMFAISRCPRCRKYQPYLVNEKFCSKCGVELKHD